MFMKQKFDLSPNFSMKRNSKKSVKFVIIHYTGMQSEIESINRLKDKNSLVSCHYLINRAGKVTLIVPENKVAWHAGKSKWKNFKDLNKYSIGIELVNKGHKFGYQNFTNLQIKCLIHICKRLKKKYNIKSSNFLGHSDIAPLRKIDPGEKFPWKSLSKHNLGLWYNEKKLDYNFKLKKQVNYLFFKNLYRIGYRYFNLIKRDKKKETKIIKVFQQRYLPKNVSGKIDQKTFKICHFLASSKKIS